MWFIGVEVEQETSTLPLKKNPGSAPVLGTMVSTINFSNVIFDVFSLFSFGKFSRMVTLLKLSPLSPYLPKWKEKKRNTEEKKDNGKAKWKISQFQPQFEEFWHLEAYFGPWGKGLFCNALLAAKRTCLLHLECFKVFTSYWINLPSVWVSGHPRIQSCSPFKSKNQDRS